MSRIPYIGNKISLVSRLDIRYEGILVNVDSKESTIALEHVRSFGTEDRVSLHHVPPRNEIFDNITFRASDIKDLIVCDSLSPLTSERFEGLYDPAIISVSRNIGHARSNIDRETNDYIQKCTDLQSTTTTQEISQPESDIVGDIGARHVHMKFQQSQSEHHPYSNNDFQSELNVYRSIPNNIRRSNKNQSFSPSSHSHPSFLFKKGYNRGQEPPSIYPPCYHQNAQQSLRRGQRSRFPKPLYTLFEPITFDSEFDFDKANEQFNNEFVQDIITGECPSPIGKPDNVMSAIGSSTTTTNSTCYNKSASFFDTISCGSFGKPLGYQERPNLKNQETFGSVPFPYKQINSAQNIDHEPQHNYHYQTAC